MFWQQSHISMVTFVGTFRKARGPSVSLRVAMMGHFWDGVRERGVSFRRLEGDPHGLSGLRSARPVPARSARSAAHSHGCAPGWRCSAGRAHTPPAVPPPTAFPGQAYVPPPAAYPPPVHTRVTRHLHTLGVLWFGYGAYRAASGLFGALVLSGPSRHGRASSAGGFRAACAVAHGPMFGFALVSGLFIPRYAALSFVHGPRAASCSAMGPHVLRSSSSIPALFRSSEFRLNGPGHLYAVGTGAEYLCAGSTTRLAERS